MNFRNPLTPCEPEFVVTKEIELLDDCVPFPLIKYKLPPVTPSPIPPIGLFVPPDIYNSPPSMLDETEVVPTPVDIRISPALPIEAYPVVTRISPETPEDEPPEKSCKSPLMPSVPLFRVATEIEPDEEDLEYPLRIRNIPPVS